MLGAATAAHQVEGNNIYNDYWVQEQVPHSTFNERHWMRWITITITGRYPADGRGRSKQLPLFCRMVQDPAGKGIAWNEKEGWNITETCSVAAMRTELRRSLQ